MKSPGSRCLNVRLVIMVVKPSGIGRSAFCDQNQTFVQKLA
jgi:hypothetical protein